MKLKTLEITGFKSFVDRLQLHFPEGITTIVGPNGCGKSNIVDAVLWAIGERSARHLRGKRMEDVIFNGADGRKPLGMAEVNLTFVNDDGSFPKGYEQCSEITITRRLYRSGESEFFINKVPCRLRDITDLFLDTGVGVNGYSIVEQGRLEHIIAASPQERRFLIEEAAGIAKYKERKRLALMKMETTQQNLLRIQDIIGEVKRQINTLERQVKRAEEYKAIRKEVREIELRFALEQYADLSEKGEATRGYLRALQERELKISTEMAEKEASVEAMRLRSMEEEEKLLSFQRELHDLSQEIQRNANEVEFLKRQREALQKQEIQGIEEVKQGLKAWRGAQRERRRIEQAKIELEGELREDGAILVEWEALYNDFRATYQEVSEQLEDEKAKLIDTLTQLTSLRNHLTHLEERKEDLQKRIRSNAKEAEEIQRTIAQRREAFESKEREEQQTRSLHLTLQAEKERWEGELETLQGALREKQIERSVLEETLRQDRSRYLSLKELQENYEGFEKGVKSILLQKREDQGKWRDILGVVADLFEPEPDYEKALEAVLGQKLQYLIVGDKREAIEAIAFLKREALGRGSFIPVTVKGQENQRDRHQAGGEGKPIPLLRFVHVKEGFAPLATFLIGGVGVVNRLEEAFHWIEEEGGFDTLVTLEGEVVDRSGIISGGTLDQGLSILERRRVIREFEKKLAEEEKAYREAYEEEERLENEIAKRSALLEKRRTEIQEKEIELLHHERDLEGLKKELSQLQQRMEVLEFEEEELRKEAGETEEAKRSLLAQMEREEAVKKERESELQSLKKTVDEVREGTEELGGRLTERKVILASLEEKRRGMETRLLDLSESLKTMHAQVLRKVSEIRAHRREGLSLVEQIGQKERELEALLERHHRSEEALVRQKERVEGLSSKWREVEASTRYLRNELEDLRKKIHEEEIRLSEYQLKLQHLHDSMTERYGATLPSSFGGTLSDEERERMSMRLAELKTTLEGFGEVNLMAIEEYQELKQRYDFLTEQQTDLQQALDTLRKAIVRINRTTTKRFLETFDLVNERFKEVFTRLFKGGQASLILLDEQDPETTGIDIMAQPPGKKLQNIDLLSGGEKALVATAFLFGLLMIKPTPFCLLDEVDAPLDDANINRFIELVKEFSKTSQFLIITHNKKTMETAQTLYGITMETPGVSKVVSVRLN